MKERICRALRLTVGWFVLALAVGFVFSVVEHFIQGNELSPLQPWAWGFLAEAFVCLFFVSLSGVYLSEDEKNTVRFAADGKKRFYPVGTTAYPKTNDNEQPGKGGRIA
jgi:hypothetical protein